MHIKLLAIAGLVVVATTAAAEDFATAQQAEALVAKAVSAVNTDKAATFKEITDKDKNGSTSISIRWSIAWRESVSLMARTSSRLVKT